MFSMHFTAAVALILLGAATVMGQASMDLSFIPAAAWATTLNGPIIATTDLPRSRIMLVASPTSLMAIRTFDGTTVWTADASKFCGAGANLTTVVAAPNEVLAVVVCPSSYVVVTSFTGQTGRVFQLNASAYSTSQQQVWPPAPFAPVAFLTPNHPFVFAAFPYKLSAAGFTFAVTSVFIDARTGQNVTAIGEFCVSANSTLSTGPVWASIVPPPSTDKNNSGDAFYFGVSCAMFGPVTPVTSLYRVDIATGVPTHPEWSIPTVTYGNNLIVIHDYLLNIDWASVATTLTVISIDTGSTTTLHWTPPFNFPTTGLGLSVHSITNHTLLVNNSQFVSVIDIDVDHGTVTERWTYQPTDLIPRYLNSRSQFNSAFLVADCNVILSEVQWGVSGGTIGGSFGYMTFDVTTGKRWWSGFARSFTNLLTNALSPVILPLTLTPRDRRAGLCARVAIGGVFSAGVVEFQSGSLAFKPNFISGTHAVQFMASSNQGTQVVFVGSQSSIMQQTITNMAISVYSESVASTYAVPRGTRTVAGQDNFYVMSRNTISSRLVTGFPLWDESSVAIAQQPQTDPIFTTTFGNYFVIGEFTRLTVLNKFTGAVAAIREVSPLVNGEIAACVPSVTSAVINPVKVNDHLVGVVYNTSCIFALDANLDPKYTAIPGGEAGFVSINFVRDDIAIVLTTAFNIVRFNAKTQRVDWNVTLAVSVPNWGNSTATWVTAADILWMTVGGGGGVVAINFTTGDVLAMSGMPYIVDVLDDGSAIAFESIGGAGLLLHVIPCSTHNGSFCTKGQLPLPPAANGTLYGGVMSAFGVAMPKRGIHVVLATVAVGGGVRAYVYVFDTTNTLTTWYALPQTTFLGGTYNTNIALVLDGWFVTMGGFNCVIEPLTGDVVFMTGTHLSLTTALMDYVSDLPQDGRQVLYNVNSFTVPQVLRTYILSRMRSSQSQRGELPFARALLPPSATVPRLTSSHQLRHQVSIAEHLSEPWIGGVPNASDFAPQGLWSWSYPTLEEGWTMNLNIWSTPSYVVMIGSDNFMHAFNPTTRQLLWSTAVPEPCVYTSQNGQGYGGFAAFSDGSFSGLCIQYLFHVDTNGVIRWHNWTASYSSASFFVVDGTDATCIVGSGEYVVTCFFNSNPTVPITLTCPNSGFYPSYVGTFNKSVVAICQDNVVFFSLPLGTVTQSIPLPSDFSVVLAGPSNRYTVLQFLNQTTLHQTSIIYDNTAVSSPFLHYENIAGQGFVWPVLTVSKGLVVFQNRSQLIAIDATTQLQKWTVESHDFAKVVDGTWIIISKSPNQNRQNVRTWVANLSLATGDVQWRINMPFPFNQCRMANTVHFSQYPVTVISSYVVKVFVDANTGAIISSIWGSLYPNINNPPFALELEEEKPCIGFAADDGYRCALLHQPIQWVDPLSNTNFQSNSPVLVSLNEQNMIVLGSSSIKVVNSATGAVVWVKEFGLSVSPNVGITRGSAFVVYQGNCTLYVFDAATGHIVSMGGFNCPFPTPEMSIQLFTSPSITTLDPSASVFGFVVLNTVYVAVVNAVTGNLTVTSLSSGGPDPANILYVSDEYVLLVSNGNQFQAFNALRNRLVEWAQPVILPFQAISAAVMNSFAYIVLQPGEVICVSLLSGDVAFILTDFTVPLNGFIASDNSNIYVGTVHNDVLKINGNPTNGDSLADRTLWVNSAGITGQPTGSVYQGLFTVLPPANARPNGLIIAQFGNAVAAFDCSNGNLIWVRYSSSVKILTIRGDWILGQLPSGAFGRFNVNTGETIPTTGTFETRSSEALSADGRYLSIVESYFIVGYDLGESTNQTLPPQPRTIQPEVSLPPGWTLAPQRSADAAVLDNGLPSLDCYGRVKLHSRTLTSCLSSAISAASSSNCAQLAQVISACSVQFSDDMSSDCPQGDSYLSDVLASLNAALPYCSTAGACDSTAGQQAVCAALTLPANATMKPWPSAGGATLPPIPTFNVPPQLRKPASAVHAAHFHSKVPLAVCLLVVVSFAVLIRRRRVVLHSMQPVKAVECCVV